MDFYFKFCEQRVCQPFHQLHIEKFKRNPFCSLLLSRFLLILWLSVQLCIAGRTSTFKPACHSGYVSRSRCAKILDKVCLSGKAWKSTWLLRFQKMKNDVDMQHVQHAPLNRSFHCFLDASLLLAFSKAVTSTFTSRSFLHPSPLFYNQKRLVVQNECKAATHPFFTTFLSANSFLLQHSAPVNSRQCSPLSQSDTLKKNRRRGLSEVCLKFIKFELWPQEQLSSSCKSTAKSTTGKDGGFLACSLYKQARPCLRWKSLKMFYPGQFFRDIRSIFTLIKQDFLLHSTALILLFGSAWCETYVPTVLRNLFNALISYQAQTVVLQCIKKIFLIGILDLLVQSFKTTLLSLGSSRATLRLQSLFYKTLLAQPMSFFDKTSTGILLNRLTTNTVALMDAVTLTFTSLLHTLALMGGALVVLFSNNPTMAMLTLHGALTAFFTSYFLTHRNRAFVKLESERFAHSNAIATSCLALIRVIFAYNSHEVELKRYQKSVESVSEAIKKQSFIKMSKQMFCGILRTSILFLLMVVGRSFVFSSHGNALPCISSHILSAQSVICLATRLGSQWGSLQEALSGSDEVLQFLQNSTSLNKAKNNLDEDGSTAMRKNEGGRASSFPFSLVSETLQPDQKEKEEKSFTPHPSFATTSQFLPTAEVQPSRVALWTPHASSTDGPYAFSPSLPSTPPSSASFSEKIYPLFPEKVSPPSPWTPSAASTFKVKFPSLYIHPRSPPSWPSSSSAPSSSAYHLPHKDVHPPSFCRRERRGGVIEESNPPSTDTSSLFSLKKEEKNLHSEALSLDSSYTSFYAVPSSSMFKRKPCLSFKNITFSYPLRPECFVLKNCSFSLYEKEVAALVGLSGSGKSTLFKLAANFYPPHSGHILLDGNDVSLLNQTMLCRLIATVEQTPSLFSMSIKENILYGLSNKNVETAAFEEAIELSGCADIFHRLPEGYNTLVGKGGHALSCGEKQAIAIARALIQKPKILLLDEATSALDTHRANIIKKAIKRISHFINVLLIAHRLDIIRCADVIHVLQDGQVRESGSHEELSRQKDSIYRRMLLKNKQLIEV